jgi:predicted nicotinamide N-methyase
VARLGRGGPGLIPPAGAPGGGARGVVLASTRLAPVAFVPEVRLHQAEHVLELWERVEALTGRTSSAPPFWAFPWAGGQVLARYVLDHPGEVAGRRVLDVASGSGLVAIAAARSGAAAVRAAEVDELAVAAVALNAAANGVRVEVVLADLLDGDGEDAEVVLAGDVFYERAMAERVLPFLRRARRRGAAVLLGDPGRAYLPTGGLQRLAEHDVPVVGDLEDRAVKRSGVWRLDGS